MNNIREKHQIHTLNVSLDLGLSWQFVSFSESVSTAFFVSENSVLFNSNVHFRFKIYKSIFKIPYEPISSLNFPLNFNTVLY